MGADKNYVKPMSEAVRMPAKTGNIIMTSINWRGRYYALRMFFPSTKVPLKLEVQIEVDKVYPGARVQSYQTADYVPGQPLLQVAEGAAWTRKAGKTKRVDSTKKAESLTKEKIQAATLRHLQRRLEIPVGHPFAPE